ncbi:MAG: glycosyltransferase family 4 protein, partial [Chloroflexi bacterium]|nr:glycosyltransferase family 4 protein [Chloroflexota bacterium]
DYRIIPHGVDLVRFSAQAPPIEDFCDGKLNILFVSRLDRRKGVSYLLKAYRLVKREIPESRLIIVGPGRRRRYEEWVRSVGLEDVVFVGYTSHDDLPRYYRTCDVFCIPAVGRESFGIVLLEAMAASRPIVATNIAGYASVVSEGVEGVLVPPRDHKSLARALVRLLNDRALRERMGRQGRSRVEGQTWDVIAGKTMDYYLELMGRHA